MENLKPKGAACIIQAVHMCMRMRGVGKQHSEMITSSMKGEFLTDPTFETKLLMMIK
jgi:GTP cyclohydrolase I